MDEIYCSPEPVSESQTCEEEYFEEMEPVSQEYSEENDLRSQNYNDELEPDSQEFTSLMPMQPLTQELQDIIENEDYSLYPRMSVDAGPSEEEVIPTEYADIAYEPSVPDEPAADATEKQNPNEGSLKLVPGNVSQKPTQDEIINKLFENKISFSQVAELLGDDGEDSDLEAPKTSSEEPPDEDHAAEFEKELNEQQRYHLKKKNCKERRRRRRMPPALLGLMGEANLRYARGEHDEAIKMCMEIIRQFPHSPEPYQTLGMIYEEKKLIDKSLQFLLIAAFLSPNAEEWEKLADLSLHQLKDIRQAIFCWGRAIRANPQNLDYHWARCDLLEQIGEKTKALKGYIHMVKFLRPDQGKDGLKLAKEIAKIHFENGDIHLAQEAMETAFRKYPSFVTAEDTNLMLEVLMQREQFVQCIGVLVQHMGVQLKSKSSSESDFGGLAIENQVAQASSCVVPDNLAIDLRVKLAIGFVQLKKFALAKPIVTTLMRLSVEEYGDLYLEVSEAYSKVQNPTKAIPLLEALLKSDTYSVAAVWLLYGQCLAMCNRLEEAAHAYSQVVELAPQLGEPRLILSGILQTLGKTQDALTVLNQEVTSEPLDSQFLFQKCEILLEHHQTEEFIKTATLFFKRDFVHIRSKVESDALLGNKKVSSKYEALRDLRKGTTEQMEDERPAFVGQEVPVEKQWTLYKTLCDVLYKEKRYVELQRHTFESLGSRDLMRDKDRAKEIEFLCLLACIYNESFNSAYNIMRELIVRSLDNNRAWNLLCFIISKLNDIRHNRFLLRLVHKHPENLALAILNGHNCLVSGTYKFAVAEYCPLYRDTDDPLIPLMLGITYTHMACQKFSGNKHHLVVTAQAFFEDYLKLRLESQEAYYNVGRAMHQLSLFTNAVFYYKKALEAPKPPPSADEPDLNLQREIAFNLALIYKRNNTNLAKYYLKKYARFD